MKRQLGKTWPFKPSGLFLMAGLVVLVACGGPGGVEDGAPGGAVRVVDLVEEDEETTLESVTADRDRRFDPLVTPSASGVDLVRLREVVELLEDPAGCPPVATVDAFGDVAEVLRLVDGCLVLEYEPLDGRTVGDVAEQYQTDSEVLAVGRPLWAIPDSGHGGDPRAGEQWHLERLGAEKLWAGWPAGTGVLVAVIDTGVDGAHHDLDDNLLHWGDDAHRRDYVGHGTHVAGIIAAEKGNGIGVAGVAPDASLIPLSTRLFWEESGQIADQQGYGPDYRGFLTFAGAVVEARRAGARVVNISMAILDSNGFRIDAPLAWCDDTSPRNCGDPLAWQIRTGQAEGMIFVASAGNCGYVSDDSDCQYANQTQYPAAYEGVIAVASTDKEDQELSTSTSAAHVDIAAPGWGILSTVPGNEIGLAKWGTGLRWNRDETDYMGGTSMATPIVTAVIAHLIARFPDATYQEITNAIYRTAHHPPFWEGDPPETGRYSQELGWGIIQPLDAIQHLHNSRTPPTTAPATTTTVTITPTTTTTAVPTTTIAAPTTTPALTTTAAPATTAAAGDRIAYVSDGINVYDLGTGHAEQITDTGYGPVWSPDGDRIAYVSDGINVYDLGTGHAEQITDTGYGPVWSPDGDRIAYVSDGINVYDLGTGHAEQINDPDDGPITGQPVWSPDGDRIAYVSDGINVYDLGTGHAEQINDPDDGPITGQPVWSPDGARIAYQSGWEGGRVIYVYDVGTGGIEWIPWSGHSWGKAWSPDGARIVYVDRWDARWDDDGFVVPGSQRYGLYVYDFGTGRVEQITDSASDDERPVWSPDGDSIATYQIGWEGGRVIKVYDLDTGRVEQITDSASDDERPVWSPDGDSIAYVSDLDGDHEIFVHDLGTGRVEQITDNTGYDGQPVWSPDGGSTADTNDPAGELGPLEEITPISITCSSEYNAGACENLIDGEETYWNDASRRGEDARITVTFVNPVALEQVQIINVDNLEEFRRNYRVRGVEVFADEFPGVPFVDEIPDANDRPHGIPTTTNHTTVLEIRVTSTWPSEALGGEAFDELAIQELKFWGRVQDTSARE